MVEVLGVSLGPTVDLGRVDYNFKMFKDGDGTATVGGIGSQTAHVSSPDILRCSLTLISSGSSPLLLDRLRLRALYKELQVWKCLRISGSFTQLPECSIMH